MEKERNLVKSQRKVVYNVLVLIAILVYALRPKETKDTMVYITSFNNIEAFSNVNISFLQKYGGYELGYIYLIKFFRILFDDYRAFFLFVSSIGLTVSLYALNRMIRHNTEKKKNYEDSNIEYLPVGAALALYVSNYGFLYNGISVRAGISIGFGLLAFSKMLEKKRIAGILFIALAFSQQRTSFLFIIAFVVYRFVPVLKRRVHIIVWGITGFLMLSGIASRALTYIIPWLMSVIDRFGISGYAAFLSSIENAVGLTDIYKWLLYGLLILICDNSESTQKYLNVVMVGAIIVVFMHDVRAVSRAYDLFYLFMIPLLSKFYYGQMENVCFLSPFKKIITYSVITIGGIMLLRTCF